MERFAYLLSFALFLAFPGFSHVQLIHTKAVDYLFYEPTVVDTHNDTMMLAIDESTWLPKIDIGEETDFHLDIPKAKAGGLHVAFFAAYTSGFYDNNARSISRTLALLNALYWTERNNPDTFKIAQNSAEIKQTVGEGKLAAVPTIEGAYSLEEHNAIELLHQYNDLGVKAIGFNWNYSNALGEGADRVYGDPAKTPSNGGLTDLGAEVVKEMNRLGMVVDVSHMSRETFWDVIQVSEAPIIASHSGVYGLKQHQRNLTDDEMLALKENGGVLSIVFFPAFLTNNSTGYVSDIVDHIDYAVDIMGIDHVGIGSDFDGAPLPEDLQSAEDLPLITDELAHRGYSLEDIEKILGGNILRLLEEVESIADINQEVKTAEPVIEPEYEMGEIIQTTTPVLQAKIEDYTELDLESVRIIVDGIPYIPSFDEETATLSLQLEENLQEKFHVVTFEAANKAGDTIRETRIFYIND